MSKTNYSVTRLQVLEHLSYNQETGELKYLTSGFKRQAGDIVPIGQNVINILGSSYSKLKLIWFIQTGSWPTGKINAKDFGAGDCRFDALEVGGSRISDSINQSRLRSVLDYSITTGLFYWKIGMSSTGRKGSVAGASDARGYILIRIDGTLYLAHRLAWLHVTGSDQRDEIDHEDGNKSNNAWINLRAATSRENNQNKYVAQENNKSSGLLSVYWSNQKNKWCAKLNHEGKQIYGGAFDDPLEAHQAYIELKRVYHPHGML